MSIDEKIALKNMFKGYKRVTNSMIKMLNDYNLIVVYEGKHYKVFRADNIGGFVTLSTSPSDGRTGLNASRYLIRLIEA